MSTSFVARCYVVVAKFWHKVVKRVRRWLGIKKTVYVQERVPFYRRIWEEAAQAEGFDFVPLSDSIWEVRDGKGRLARINNYVVSLDDPVTLDIAGDKLLTYELLAEAGLTIPRYAAVTMSTLGEIQRFIDAGPGPYVVKPARYTSSGLGISTNLDTVGQCFWAAGLAFAYCGEILIEEHVVGESYRLLFLDNELICASRRAGIRIEADGERNLAELIDADFRESGRWNGKLEWRRDPDVRLTIESQGLTVESVPPGGESVLVKSAGAVVEGSREVRTIYTEDVTGLLCAEVVEQGRRASVALGSEFCGVDMITVDPTVPLAAVHGTINEINTTPGLHHHYDLESSKGRVPLANTVLRYIAAKRDRR